MEGQQSVSEETLLKVTKEDLSVMISCVGFGIDRYESYINEWESFTDSKTKTEALAEYKKRHAACKNLLQRLVRTAFIGAFFLCSFSIANAQLYTSIGAGAAAPGGLLGELSIGYKYKSFQLQGGFQSIMRADQPVLLQLRVVKDIPVHHFSIKPFVGYSRYQLSGDDKSRNSNSYTTGVYIEKAMITDGSVFAGFTKTKNHLMLSAGFVYWFSGNACK